jgi:transcriptional regulator with XRE-family HTH domain
MKPTKNQKTRKKNPYPSEATRWAYWMQAIEPNSEAINEAFPGYHPLWVQRSQAKTVSPEQFKWIRRYLLGVSRKQCAAYLRVGESTIRRWECGLTPVPFMAFELLRLVYDSVTFKVSHPAWDGWFISRDGGFVSPTVGKLNFTPEQLNHVPQLMNWNANLRAEVEALKTQLDEAHAENTRLREMFVSQGVVDEIDTIKNRLGELFGQLNTARIFKLPLAKEKAA